MNRWVEITFDCLPLRSFGRLDVPIDASPRYRARCLRIQQACEKHGLHNTYFLCNATCKYHLTNKPELGTLEFRFEGVVLTDDRDLRTDRCELEVELVREHCDWLTADVVQWFKETVPRSVAAEFDRYIEAGDLEQARKRLEKIQAVSDASGGYLGMYL